MRSKIGVAVVLTSLAGPAHSVNDDDKYSVIGLGGDSCGSFTSAVQKGNHQGDWTDWNGYLQYTMGHLTAVNYYEKKTTNILGSTDGDGVMANIEQFCKNNPLKMVIDGIDATKAELYPHRKQ